MVGLSGVRSHDDENPDDQEKVEDNRPPGVGREGAPSLDLSDNRGNESDDPRELDDCQYIIARGIRRLGLAPEALAYR